MRARSETSAACLHGHLLPRYLVPDQEALRTFLAILFGAEPMSPWTEVLADRSKGREEALGVTGRFETLQHPEGTRAHVCEWAGVSFRRGCSDSGSGDVPAG